jgi:hypothetical protein
MPRIEISSNDTVKPLLQKAVQQVKIASYYISHVPSLNLMSFVLIYSFEFCNVVNKLFQNNPNDIIIVLKDGAVLYGGQISYHVWLQKPIFLKVKK